MNGILNVYKPSGLTSHAVVSRIRKFYGVKKAGHAGTLDPMATGVLPVLIGSATSVQDMLTGHDKVYRAGVLFGVVTDTADITGNVISESEVSFDESDLLGVINGFIGKQKQVPPMYSALQKDGVRLYDLARRGIEVEREARDITVYSIDVAEPFDGRRCVLDISCSKGTYIRTLCEDIGKKLGCGAALQSLERLSCGSFSAKDAVKLEDIEELYKKGDVSSLEGLLVSPKVLFEGLPEVRIADFYVRLALNGAEIYLKKAGIKEKIFDGKDMCRMCDKSGNFFATGVLSDYPDGKAIKIKYRF